MLSVLLWGLAALLALVVLAVVVLFLPFRLRLSARSAPGAFIRVEVRPFAGLLPWIPLVDSTRPKEPEPEAEPETPEPERPAARKRRGPKIDVRRVLRALPRFIRDALRVFRIDRIEVEGIFGLGDPAETGAAYGTIAPPLVAAGYALGCPEAVRVTPDFDRATLEGRAEAEITVRPARAIRPTVAFAWAVFGPRRWT